MKKITRAFAFVLAVVSVFSLASCSLLSFSREFKLVENFMEPETYKAVYSYVNSNDSASVCYTIVYDENGNMYYSDHDDVEFYYIMGDDGYYTKHSKTEDGWKTSSGSAMIKPEMEMAHVAYYDLISKYYFKTYYGKVKQLKDVEFLGRDCYAYQVTIEDNVGKSYTVTTVKEVYIDKETGMLMKDIVTDYDNPTDTENRIGTGYICTEFTVTPEAVAAPRGNQYFYNL